MKILVLSDIHNNLVAVRRMRHEEQNVFDAIVVAGDIGRACAPKFFDILSTFNCPVLYVYGNWDHELEYSTPFAGDSRHLHLNVVEIGGYFFAGFSGCPTKWGKNPLALKLGDTPDAARQTLHLNRDALRRIVAPLDPRRTIVVTHERLTRYQEVAPGSFMHLYGHIHNFSKRVTKQTTFINVSVLDRPITARPRRNASRNPAHFRNYNAGNYVIIEMTGSDNAQIECVSLPQNYPEWIPTKNQHHHGIEWIAEEQEWTDPTDPRLLRYHVNYVRN